MELIDQKARLVAVLQRMPFDEDQKDVIVSSMTSMGDDEAKKVADELEEALNLIGEALNEWPA